jgi:hypothetical protein
MRPLWVEARHELRVGERPALPRHCGGAAPMLGDRFWALPRTPAIGHERTVTMGCFETSVLFACVANGRAVHWRSLQGEVNPLLTQ